MIAIAKADTFTSCTNPDTENKKPSSPAEKTRKIDYLEFMSLEMKKASW